MLLPKQWPELPQDWKHKCSVSPASWREKEESYLACDLKSKWLLSVHRKSEVEKTPLEGMPCKCFWRKKCCREITLESSWAPETARIPVSPYLLVSKLVQYRAQLLRVAVKSVSSNGWVGIPPVHREAMVPEAPTLLDVRWLDAGVEAMHLAATVGHADLKLVVIVAQPMEQTRCKY